MEFVTTLGENKNYYDQQLMILQQKATELLATCNKRPLIALDLDYTMWPANCFEHTIPPYRTVEESQRSSSHNSSPANYLHNHNQLYSASIMKEKILCLDRRTNHERSLVLYPQIKSILEWCADQRIVLTICSKSPDLTIVKQILQAFGIWDWFLFPQIYNSRKTYHFRNLTEVTGLKMNDFLFFDDDHTNITCCTKIGVSSCLVDKQVGLTWNTLIDGLAQFANTHKAANAMASWLSSEKLLLKSSPTNYDQLFAKRSGTTSKTTTPRSYSNTGIATPAATSASTNSLPSLSIDLTSPSPIPSSDKMEGGMPKLVINT
mmetsp:Transcript_6089/g.6698  ORF Transcript_6089/g.6698 Transcript_6089/m.6698 type:complete len:319 (-) Transcript_6089:1136-2092(-)